MAVMDAETEKLLTWSQLLVARSNVALETFDARWDIYMGAVRASGHLIKQRRHTHLCPTGAQI